MYERERLGSGDRLQGPAIVTSLDSTCFLREWQVATTDAFGNLVIGEAH